MRIPHAALLLLALLGVCVSAHAPQTSARPNPPQSGTARIRGQVLAADTGTPVRGALVELASPGPGGWVTTTDSDGRFDFLGLPAGTFVLAVTKPGFIDATFGQTPALPKGGSIDLVAGQSFDRADVRMPRNAVIAGRVFDEYGEPAIEAYVTALKVEYISGMRRLRAARPPVQTNDLGEFRLYGLQPGKYVVAVGFRAMQQAAVAGAGRDQAPQYVASGEGIAPTFYPGTARSIEAQPIVVEAGGATPTIAIALQSVRFSRISGTIVNSSGRNASGMVVMINPATADGLPVSMNVAEPDAGGHFTLQNIAPGAYRIDVVSRAMLDNVAKNGTGRPQAMEDDEFASVPVSVNGDDIDGLVVTTTRGFQMAGRIVVEGGTATADAIAKINVAVSPMIPGVNLSNQLLNAEGAAADDGTFVARGLIGPRLVRAYGLPPGWALKSVRVGGADVTDAGFEMNGDIAGAEVVVTAKPAQVSGVVIDERGAPLKDYSVAIFSEDRRLWTLTQTRYVVSVRTDANGQFTIAALPPGAYFAVAAAALVDGEWAETESLEKLRAKATPFSLADGELKAISLVFPPR